MKQIILFGDPTYPLYHPYKEVSDLLESIFEDFQVTGGREHFETFEAWDYEPYDLAVFYTDHWIDKSGTSPQQVQALLHYVARGGSLLVLHNLDLTVDPEVAQMLGARLRHPLENPGPLRKLRFLPDETHPVSRGVEAFTLEEERFGVEYGFFTERQEFLQAVDEEGISTPAGWTSCFGRGRAAYLSPGHTREAFADPSCRRLIRQAARWLTNFKEEDT